MYQCDLTQGLSHFRVDVRRGMELMEQLTGYISGYAVPKYVIDAPGGGGKIPVTTQYIKEFDGSQVILRNYKGDEYTYPDNLDI